MRQLRLATRGSAQATAQSQAVADALTAAQPDLRIELVFVETLGDQRADVALHTMGGQGVFVKAVQQAVLDGHADIAAHSAKDLPSQPAEGLRLAAFCRRRSPADALVGASIAELAAGATVATGSIRRQAQLAALRPDLAFVELRGSIHTRLSKVPAGGSIVIAVAALQILGLTDRIAQTLDTATFVPSPGQGCVAIECRSDDRATADLLAVVDHPPTRRAVEAERAFLAELGAGCSLPIGAFATAFELTGFLADDDGRCLVRSIALRGRRADRNRHAAALAIQMYEKLAAW